MKITALFLFLVLLVFLSYEMNLRYQKKELISENWNLLENENRKLASNQGENRNIVWEKYLLKQIKQDRGAASLSEGKWDQAKLTLSELVGNYRLVTQPNLQGHVFVKELEFIYDDVDSLTKPLVVEDVSVFLSKNSYLFGLNQSAELIHDTVKNDALIYGKTQDGRKAIIEVHRDHKKRLLRLSIHYE